MSIPHNFLVSGNRIFNPITSFLNVFIIDGLVKSRHSGGSRNPGFPVKTGIQFFLMAPRFRVDHVWPPAFAGVTIQETFCETIIIIVA